MKKFLVIAALALSANAFATVSITSGLTPDQIATLTAQAEQMKSTVPVPDANVSSKVRQEAEAWGQLGGNMGKAMVGAAKEIGVAADQFSQTGLGKVVMAIVIFKLVGAQIMHMLIGTSILALGAALMVYLLRTRFGEITYEYKSYLFGMWQRKVIVKIDEDDDHTAQRLVATAVVVLVSLLIGLNVLF